MSCLEQLMLAIIGLIGGSEVKSRVCAEPDVDKSASICFSCSGGDARHSRKPDWRVISGPCVTVHLRSHQHNPT